MSEETDKTNATEPKKDDAGSSDHINLKVVNQDNSEVYFKIKRNTALRKLMEAYAARQGLAVSSIRFLYDGNRIQPDQTPKQLEMEDSDSIDALLEQTGGR